MNELTTEQVLERRWARHMALAIIRRGRDARIPENCLRIKEDAFKEVLSPEYHDVAKFANDVYNNSNFLLKRKFISIDGGNSETRLKAAYAILFRMIAYDKIGMYCDCVETGHRFQSIRSNEEITRNDLAEELKGYDILLIGEFDRTQFKPHFETAEFFDEVLGHRVNYSKPTLVTSVSAIVETSKENRAASGKSVSDAGRYLSQLAIAANTTDNVLRVRTRIK